MITPEELQRIKARAAAVQIFTDKFGGRFMLRRDWFQHGHQACIDRQLLLEHLAALNRQAGEEHAA